MNHPGNQPPEKLDLSEKGRDAAGQVVSSDRRLFMQLHAFGGCTDIDAVISAVRELKAPVTVYADVNDPSGIGIVSASENPDYFVKEWRELLQQDVFTRLTYKPEFTMLGRTYSIGYEQDLDRILVDRPIERMTNPDWPWAVWYPLRRSGAFAKLPDDEQKAILGEHGKLGAMFSVSDLGMDIRLDCRALDKNDNDFVIGLIGRDLFPLSAMVQAMRKTRQTSEFLESLGPFFVGKAVWQQVVE